MRMKDSQIAALWIVENEGPRARGRTGTLIISDNPGQDILNNI